MFDKLATVEARYEEQTASLGTSFVQNDPAEYRKQAKMLSELEPLVEKYREYKVIAGELAQAEELASGGDPEMRGLAEEGGTIMAVDRRVAELMTTQVTTCGPEDKVKNVMAEMTRRRVRHLPVVEDGRLAGIVSIGDVVKSRLEEMELETLVLRDAYIAAH